MSANIVSIGGATQDVFVRSEGAKVFRITDKKTERAFIGFDYGAKINVENIKFTVGGGATNTAVSFSKLGLKAACMAQIGKDAAGQQVLENLKEEGVETHLIQQKEGDTGYSVILTSYEGERSILAYRGVNSQYRSENIPYEALKDAQWFYISSLSGESDQILEPLFQFAKAQGISIAFNPGGTQLKRPKEQLTALLQYVDILFVNKEEAAQITELPLERPLDEHLRSHTPQPSARPAYMYDLSAHFKALKKSGPKHIIITDGSRGTQYYNGTQAYAMPGYPVEVADVLGAGDAFGSGFTAGWIYTQDIAYALKLASANAANVVTDPGSHFGLQTRASAEAFIKEHPLIQPILFEI